MPYADRTSRLIKFRSLTLANQLVLQLVVPGLFILQSNLNQYGIWLALNSYSGFVTFLDLGLFAVIPTNAMSHSPEKLSKIERSNLVAMRDYSILVSFIAIFSLLTALIIGRIVDLTLLKSDFFLYVVLSSVNVSLILLLRYFEASFRSVNSTYGFMILTLHAVSTTFFTILVLVLKGSILDILATNLIITLLFLIHYLIKGDAFDYEHISIRGISAILRKFAKQALTYQMFPIGYMLINQGIIIMIQHLVSFDDVGTLGVIRVVAGVFRQISSVFVASSIPQIALLLKAKDFTEADLHFTRMKKIVYGINSIILVILTCCLLICLFLGYSSIYEIPILICLYFVISAGCDVPWNVWIALPISANMHGNLGFRFLLSSVLTLALSSPLYKYLGLQGIAFALIMQDLLMTKQSIRQGKQILESV